MWLLKALRAPRTWKTVRGVYVAGGRRIVFWADRLGDWVVHSGSGISACTRRGTVFVNQNLRPAPLAGGVVDQYASARCGHEGQVRDGEIGPLIWPSSVADRLDYDGVSVAVHRGETVDGRRAWSVHTVFDTSHEIDPGFINWVVEPDFVLDEATGMVLRSGPFRLQQLELDDALPRLDIKFPPGSTIFVRRELFNSRSNDRRLARIPQALTLHEILVDYMPSPKAGA